MGFKRAFKGIWIPSDIWLSTELSMQEKIMLAEISSLDTEEGCYASNAYFAEFFGLSKNRVSVIINELADKGYLTVELKYKGDSREIDKRIIHVCFEQGVSLKTVGGITENSEGVSLDLKGGITESSEGIIKTIKKTITKNMNSGPSLFSVAPTKKDTKAKDIVTMKGMISVFTISEDLQDVLGEYLNIRFKKGLQPNQWKIILDDLKTVTGSNIELAIEKVRGAIAGGYMQIVPPWEKSRYLAFGNAKFDNTSGREVKSVKNMTEDERADYDKNLATDKEGNLIKF